MAFAAHGGESEYGQSYEYTKEEQINGVVQQISSGVAAYEPGIGGEENLLKEAKAYQEKFLLAPNNEYYIEGPIGEALYPAPQVGYSQVKVKDIANNHSFLNRSKTGYSLHQFYTAKDFPVQVKATKLVSRRAKSNPIIRFLKLNAKDGLSYSQGYTVEINDMHGKQKREAVYDKNDALLSASQYEYKVADKTAGEQNLSNEVEVLSSDGRIKQANIGMSLDVWQEMLEERNTTHTLGAAPNVNGFPAFIFPVTIPTVFPVAQREQTQFKAAITTKLIKRCGILEKVRITENGSTIETKNVLFDEETGGVLLSQTENEYSDPIYNFSYPAHWIYESMGQGYQNIGSVFEDLVFSAGRFPSTFNHAAYFHPGDELLLQYTDALAPQKERYQYVRHSSTAASVIDKNGNPFDSGGKAVRVKIIRSGYRNQAAISVGQISSLKSPVVNNQINPSQATQILEANVRTFIEIANIACEMKAENRGFDVQVFDRRILNPYKEGGLGNWRPDASYVYYESRNPNSLANGAVKTRNTGELTSFAPFWIYSQGKWHENHAATKWTRSNKVSLYDWRGNELENIDALGIASAAYFGYGKNLVTAVANNAQYREIVSEGFEDYAFKRNCTEAINYRRSLELFDASEGSNDYELAKGIGHTGKHSLKFGANKSVEYTLRTSNYCPFGESVKGNSLTTGCYTSVGATHYKNECCSCLPLLAPDANKSYNISVWVATDPSLEKGTAPAAINVKVGYVISDVFKGYGLQLTASGPVIEGWQRLEGKVAIPPNASYVKLQLSNTGSSNSYFDDFRFHPFLSNMQSYVYDPFSERLMATLDENNYASFYEYNDEGILIRTKRETEKGIVTIEEGRTELKKN